MNPKTIITHKNILIVDDDKTLCVLIQKRLERNGFNISSVNSSEDAIVILNQMEFDLVFIDYVLHDTTALDLITETDKLGLTFPFIVMTGNSDIRVAVDMMKRGAIDYLIKDHSLLNTLPVVLDRVLQKLEIENNLRNTQKALTESEDKFKTLTNVAQDAIISINQIGNIIYWNPAAELILGYKQEDVLGKNLHQLIVPEKYHQAHYKGFEIFNQSGKGNFIGKVVELEAIKKGGLVIPIELSISAFHNEEGWQSVAILRDITIRKAIERKLVDTNEKLQNILFSISDGFFAFDDTRMIYLYNSSAELLFGRKRSEVIGRNIFEAFPEFNGTLFQEKFENVLQNKKSESFELFFDTPPFNDWYNIRAYPQENGIAVYFTITTEQKEAEFKLRESEERYKNLIRNLPNMLLIYSEGKFMYANTALLKWIDKSYEEIDGTSILFYIDPADHQKAIENFQKRKSGIHVDDYELKLIVRNETKFVLVSGENTIFEGKNAMVIVLSDITERKKLEAENKKNLDIQKIINVLLKMSQKNIELNDILNLALQMIASIPWLSFDSKACIFLANNETNTLEMVARNNLPDELFQICKRVSFGKCLCGKAAVKKEVIYTCCIDQQHQINYVGIQPHGHYCVPILLGEKTFGIINIYLSPNHLRNQFEIDFLTVVANTLAEIIARTNSEKSLHITLTNMEILVAKRTLELKQKNLDLTTKIEETEQAKKDLQLSEEKFRITIEQAVDAIFMGDSKGNFIGVNNNACKLTGYTKEELLTMNMSSLFTEEVLKNIPLRYDLLDQGEIVITQRPLTCKNGAIITIEMKTKKMLDGTYQAFISDISKRVEAEKNIQAALEKEKELNMLKTRFISVVSHEFRTPLAGISSSIELIQKFGNKWTEEKKNEMYSRIFSSIRYTNLLLDDVSLIGKDDSGKLTIKIIEFNLDEFCHKIAQDLHAVFEKETPINIYIHSSLTKIKTDDTLLRHILNNLLSNGLKYSHCNPVELYIEPHDKNFIKIIVKDQGIGIPEEDLKYIFEPFHRASNVETIKGTGLGLPIVKRCVDMLDGVINIKSIPNHGTSIYVIIPVQIDE